MLLPSMKKYPKEIVIGEHVWKVKFVNRPLKWGAGQCSSRPRQILINMKANSNKYELFRTFIHEVLHAIEFEHEKRINHKTIYFLETAIADLLLRNF